MWWRMIRTDAAAAAEVEARIQAFLAAQILPFRARYDVGDGALNKAMAAAGGWAPLGPRLLWPCSSVPDEEIATLAEAARTAFPEWWQ